MSVYRFGRMIKFSHTVFALPFALTSAVLASREYGMTWIQFFLVVAAMVGARTAAMGFNRIVDAKYDAMNPRTEQREIPSGKMSVGQAGFFVAAASVLLMAASYFLNAMCFYLSPLALVIVFFYSYTKRFTAYSHLFLGLALSLAPIGAWIAIAGGWNWGAILMGMTVLLWVAGFDIIYACQDLEFDIANSLYSIPSRFGVARALWFSRVMHGLTVVGLASIGVWFDLSWSYYTGIILIATILFYEQSLVRATDLSRVNMAFFNMNGIISLTFFFATLVDVVWLTS